MKDENVEWQHDKYANCTLQRKFVYTDTNSFMMMLTGVSTANPPIHT